MTQVGLGFAGSLSTVSSFVNECRLLPPRHAARYALATLALGQALSGSYFPVVTRPDPHVACRS